jgi:hypothetical protein
MRNYFDHLALAITAAELDPWSLDRLLTQILPVLKTNRPQLNPERFSEACRAKPMPSRVVTHTGLDHPVRITAFVNDSGWWWQASGGPVGPFEAESDALADALG